MEKGDAWFVHFHPWIQCNFAVHWHITAFFNNLFHHKELVIEPAKPERTSFLLLYPENIHVSGKHWKKVWKDSEMFSLTITHCLPCGVGRRLNLGCGNHSQVLCCLLLSVNVHKESKTGKANNKAHNYLDRANQRTKGCRRGCRLHKEVTNSSNTLPRSRNIHMPPRKKRNLVSVLVTLIS